MPSYMIDQIEGIGLSFAIKLAEASIQTTEDLLERCGTPQGRKQVSEQCGIAEAQLLKWTNMADLMRISGVGGQYAELLEAAGVDTVKELRTRNAANLAAKMKEVNDSKNLANASPPEAVVAGWIQAASALEPKISY